LAELLDRAIDNLWRANLETTAIAGRMGLDRLAMRRNLVAVHRDDTQHIRAGFKVSAKDDRVDLVVVNQTPLGLGLRRRSLNKTVVE
jgi:hypothetical protein